MSFGWTLAGTLAQMMLGCFLFMLVIVSATSLGSLPTLGRLQLGLLNLSIYLLPALCACSALIVIYLHRQGGSALSYWWYAMPVAASALYLCYVMALNHR